MKILKKIVEIFCLDFLWLNTNVNENDWYRVTKYKSKDSLLIPGAPGPGYGCTCFKTGGIYWELPHVGEMSFRDLTRFTDHGCRLPRLIDFDLLNKHVKYRQNEDGTINVAINDFSFYLYSCYWTDAPDNMGMFVRFVDSEVGFQPCNERPIPESAHLLLIRFNSVVVRKDKMGVIVPLFEITSQHEQVLIVDVNIPPVLYQNYRIWAIRDSEYWYAVEYKKAHYAFNIVEVAGKMNIPLDTSVMEIKERCIDREKWLIGVIKKMESCKFYFDIEKSVRIYMKDQQNNDAPSFKVIGREIKGSVLRILFSFVIICSTSIISILIGGILNILNTNPLLTIIIQCIVIAVPCYWIKEIVRFLMMKFGLNENK